jgi:hypothetical protein
MKAEDINVGMRVIVIGDGHTTKKKYLGKEGEVSWYCGDGLPLVNFDGGDRVYLLSSNLEPIVSVGEHPEADDTFRTRIRNATKGKNLFLSEQVELETSVGLQLDLCGWKYGLERNTPEVSVGNPVTETLNARKGWPMSAPTEPADREDDDTPTPSIMRGAQLIRDLYGEKAKPRAILPWDDSPAPEIDYLKINRDFS